MVSIPISWGVLEGVNQQFAETLRSEQSLEESEGVWQAKEGTRDTQSKGSCTCYRIHYFFGCAFPSTERHFLRQIIPGGVLNTGQNSSEQKPWASYILYKGIIEVQSVRADFSFSCIYVSPPKVNHSLSQRSAQIIFLSNVVFNTHKTYLDISTWNINGRIIFITKLPLIP